MEMGIELDIAEKNELLEEIISTTDTLREQTIYGNIQNGIAYYDAVDELSCMLEDIGYEVEGWNPKLLKNSINKALLGEMLIMIKSDLKKYKNGCSFTNEEECENMNKQSKLDEFEFIINTLHLYGYGDVMKEKLEDGLILLKDIQKELNNGKKEDIEISMIQNMDNEELKLVYNECLNLQDDEEYKPHQFFSDIYCKINNVEHFDQFLFKFIDSIFKEASREIIKRLYAE